MRLTEKQLQQLVGRDYKAAMKSLEMEMIKHAKKLTDKKLTSIKVTNAGLDFESKQIFVEAQGKWSGQGAINYILTWPLKIGSFKSRFLEDVGNIPD